MDWLVVWVMSGGEDRGRSPVAVERSRAGRSSKTQRRGSQRTIEGRRTELRRRIGGKDGGESNWSTGAVEQDQRT
jgi:hypothetical protein